MVELDQASLSEQPTILYGPENPDLVRVEKK